MTCLACPNGENCAVAGGCMKANPKVTALPYMGEPKPGDKRYIPPQPTIPLTHAQLKDLKDGV